VFTERANLAHGFFKPIHVFKQLARDHALAHSSYNFVEFCVVKLEGLVLSLYLCDVEGLLLKDYLDKVKYAVLRNLHRSLDLSLQLYVCLSQLVLHDLLEHIE